ncbi:MAG TPA: hypothetical protein VMS64_26085 [Candidatus Methylomirabilis sp.]|nr:hypothetical protein [Candidatus Methylomirabilis sp.]
MATGLCPAGEAHHSLGSPKTRPLQSRLAIALAGPRNAEIGRYPQLEHRGVLQTVDSRHRLLRLVGARFRLEHARPGLDREPSILDEYTNEILEEEGYSTEETARSTQNTFISAPST